MSTLSPTAGELDDQSWCRLSRVLDEFERLWQRHADPPPGIAAMKLPPPGDPLRGRVLIELVKTDQEYRWRGGEPRKLAIYLKDWPELHSSTATQELLEAEIVTRFAYEDPIPPVAQIRKEIENRFSREVWQSIDIGSRSEEHTSELQSH